MADFYILNNEFENFDPTKMEELDDLNIFKQKLFLLLNTNQGEVLGSVNFGSSLYQFLFELNLSEKEVEDMVIQQIKRYIPEANEFDLKVSIQKLTSNFTDIFILDFIIDGRKSFTIIG